MNCLRISVLTFCLGIGNAYGAPIKYAEAETADELEPSSKSSSKAMYYVGGALLAFISGYILYSFGYKTGLLDTLDAVEKYNDITPRVQKAGSTGYVVRSGERSWSYEATWPEGDFEPGGIAVIHGPSSGPVRVDLFGVNPWMNLR